MSVDFFVLIRNRPSVDLSASSSIGIRISISFCTRSVLLWNISKKSVRTGPAGRPAPDETPQRDAIWAPFFEVRKMDIFGAYSKQYRWF